MPKDKKAEQASDKLFCVAHTRSNKEKFILAESPKKVAEILGGKLSKHDVSYWYLLDEYGHITDTTIWPCQLCTAEELKQVFGIKKFE